ncbi:MAG: hypothetical protein AAGA56_03860 [Myxococcota bacterium]
MTSKLETFLNEHQIDVRRVVNASQELERLRPEDRKIRLLQKQARKKEDGKVPEGTGKPRSGRPVTTVGLGRALAGDKVPGPQKTRILKAVNHLLTQKKKDTVTIEQLFDVPPQNPPKPKAEAEEGAGES